jgi:hypothetical protein
MSFRSFTLSLYLFTNSSRWATNSLSDSFYLLMPSQASFNLASKALIYPENHAGDFGRKRSVSFFTTKPSA